MQSYSVVIVTYQRCAYLKRCLVSVNRSTFQPKEVVVIVNGNDTETTQLLAAEFPDTIVKVIDKATPGEARNIGSRIVSGEYILFLDDDAEIPSGYSETAREFIVSSPQASIFGGPDSTANCSTLYEFSVGQTLKSPLATAHTRLRHSNVSESSPERCDDSSLILCALWFKRSLFKDEGLYFDSRFFRNEENVYIRKAMERGHEVWYHPSLCAIHRRRDNPVALSRGIFGSAYFRMKSMVLIPSSFSPLYLAPSFFLIYLLSLPFSHSIGGHYILAFYALIVGVTSLWFSAMNPLVFVYNVVNHLIFNIAYGAGALRFLLHYLLNFKSVKEESYAE